MQGLGAAKRAIGEFTFNMFHILREMRISVTPNDRSSINRHPVIDLELCMETETQLPKSRLCLQFYGVSSLKIAELSGESRIGGFDVLDLSNDQLEGVNWQVIDYEDGILSFYAKDIEVTSATIVEN